MTVLDPTPELELRLLRERVADYDWAMQRLIELLSEALPDHGEELMRAVSRLHLENLERQAMLTRMDNAQASR